MTGSEGAVVVSANLLSPRVTAVNDSALQSTEGPADFASTKSSGRQGELWVGLAGFALALLLLEWWTYHRRLTV